MRRRCRWLFALLLAAPASSPAVAQDRRGHTLQIPVDYYRLSNGLRVVLSRDTTLPTAVIAVFYDVGFRNEPRGRTGFAHLFEHLMFQGSRNLGKGEFTRLVEQNGGLYNGSTRFDYTSLYELVPSHTVRRVLWAEADRMRGLAVDTASLRTEREVVKSEVRSMVLNRPYGGFPWIDMPMRAFTKWHNSHNWYGEMADLDAATLEDTREFFRTFYAPNNAVLVVTGDIDVERTRGWIAEYFGDIPSSALPVRPEISEPRQRDEKRVFRIDSLAPRPALALAYQLPHRFTPEWYAFGLLDQVLAQGRDSRFYHEVVQRRALSGSVDAGFGLGSMFDYRGPALWQIWIYHDADQSRDSILSALDAVIEPLRTTPLDQPTLDLARVKLRSSLYASMEYFGGYGRATMLGLLAMYDDAPARLNDIETGFAAVTPAVLQRTVREFLRPGNRTIEYIVPGARRSGGIR